MPQPTDRDAKTVMIDVGPPSPSGGVAPPERVPTRGDAFTDEATIVVAAMPQVATKVQRIGEYQLVKELGRGGWGTVYKALHSSMGRMVALKLLHQATGTALKRFDREIHVQARLRHPNICPAFDSGIAPDGRPYLVMDYIEGQPLSRLIADRALTDVQLAQLLAKVARALHHAHQRGILHRDIKPDNILVDRSRQPYVVDFGIARDTEDDGEALTRVGQVVGTPYYIAPEQIRSQPLGPPTDVWALGVVLYTGLSGSPPFRGRTELETLDQVLKHAPPRPTRPGGPVPNELWAICKHCLEKESSRRYPTALELARDLERFARDQPIDVAPDGLSDRMARWVRHRAWPVHAAAYGAGTAVIMGLLGALLVHGMDAWVTPDIQSEARTWVLELLAAGTGLLVVLGVAVARGLATRPPEDQEEESG